MTEWGSIVLLACVAICTITDVRTGFIFDRIVFPSLLAAIVAAACAREIVPATYGALSSAGAMFGLHLAGGRKAMGLGDVKLALVIGAALGVIDGFIALGAAFISGGIVAIILLLTRRVDRKTRIPFAPFLAFGCIIALLYKELYR